MPAWNIHYDGNSGDTSIHLINGMEFWKPVIRMGEFGGLGTGGTSHDFSTESFWEGHLDTADASEIWLTT